MAASLPDGGGGGGDDDENAGIFAEINITPLTDVFLVMMIIFMISALAVQAEAAKRVEKVEQQAESEKRSGLQVKLPEGAAQEIDPTKASLVLLIPVEGDIAVDGKIVRDADIDNLFRAAFAKDKNTQVVLQADKGVPHGRVVNVMERAKGAGLSRLAIGTSGGK